MRRQLWAPSFWVDHCLVVALAQQRILVERHLTVAIHEQGQLESAPCIVVPPCARMPISAASLSCAMQSPLKFACPVILVAYAFCDCRLLNLHTQFDLQ